MIMGRKEVGGVKVFWKLKSKNKEAILGINIKQMCVFESVLFIMEEILVQIYNTLKCKNVKILSNKSI